MKSGFKYRVAFGAWINDMRNEGMPGEGWPSVLLDEQAEKDIIKCLELQSKAGFNMFDVWGLLVSFSWPLDIKSAVDDKRRERINRIIQAAHELGIKVISGLGVYSWGFDEIIKNCPGVRGPNPHAMCAASEESWEWMKKILDFLLSDFKNLDGIHMESADLGRCTCDICSKRNDIEYHSKINIRVADYVREKYPDKIIMVNTCGFKPFKTEEEWKSLMELSSHIDFMIIPQWWVYGGYFDEGGYYDEETRIRFAKGLKCDFGSSGGVWVYPPQPWDRLRWFLPYARRTGENIKQLFKEGGRAVEYYMGPVKNPGVEVNIAFGGRMLTEPEREVKDVLCDVLEMLYRPKDEETCRKLADIFLRAEDAYFNNCYDTSYFNNEKKLCELRLTHLWEKTDGPAAYLSTYDDEFKMIMMDSKGRSVYRKELISILEDISGIEDKISDKERLERVKICISNVIKDIDALGYYE